MTEDTGIKRVVGLKYDAGQGPPRVVLKGAGKTAEQVIDRARQLAKHKIVKDEKLLERLFRLPIEAAIDADLFQLVAILLVHVYSMDEALRKAAEEQKKI